MYLKACSNIHEKLNLFYSSFTFPRYLCSLDISGTFPKRLWFWKFFFRHRLLFGMLFEGAKWKGVIMVDIGLG
jgi:hypothetical protein